MPNTVTLYENLSQHNLWPGWLVAFTSFLTTLVVGYGLAVAL